MEDRPAAVPTLPARPARGWYLLSILVIVAATLAPVALLSQATTKNFRVGTVFTQSGDEEIQGTRRLGPFPVRDHKFYQMELRAVGTAVFRVHLEYQDGTGSKNYDPQLSFDQTVQYMHPIARANRDDPTAWVVIEVTDDDPARTLRLQRLGVYEVSKGYYVWRAVVQTGSVVLLTAGLAFLGLQYYRRRSVAGPGVDRAGARATRRSAAYAAVLLTLACSFGVVTLQSQHTRLFRQPVRPSIIGWDGSFYYFWLRSAMVEGDVDFAKDLRYCNSMTLAIRETALRDLPRTPTGLIPNKYPIGWALFGVPWYVAADATARVINACGGEVQRDGWGPLYQAFLVAGQIFYAAVGLWMAYRIVSEWLPPVFAVSGVALGWLCAPLAYYQTLDIAMAHNVMFFALMGAFLAALKLRRDPARVRWWVLVGLCCALAILSRYQGAVLLLFPGVVCLQEVWRAPRRWTHLAAGIAASLVPLTIQVLAWKALYGSYFLYTYQGEGFDWLQPHLWESLFSPFHGLFNWHPALLVGFGGFVAWAVTTPRRTEAVCFALSLALTVYVNSAWYCWWFGDAFGGRAYEGCTLFAMLGFGWILHALARRAALFYLTAAFGLVAAVWSMNLLWLTHDGPLALGRPIPWSEKVEMTRRFWFPGL